MLHFYEDKQRIHIIQVLDDWVYFELSLDIGI